MYESLWKENKEINEKIEKICKNEQKKLKKKINGYKMEIDNIRLRLNFEQNPKKIINKKFKNINKLIKKKYSDKFKEKYNYKYIFDALNIEGGRINKFTKIRKILEKNSNLRNSKILIIVRSVLQYQSSEENKECIKLVKKYNNITIKYIHTTIENNNKKIILINSCNNSDYCTDSHRESKIKLCTTPIIEYLKIQPNHTVCEIDDILVYYYSLLSIDSKIVSRTEDYSRTIGLNEINSLKLFLNIPITNYTNNKNYLTYIDTLDIKKTFIKLYNEKRIKRNRIIILKNNSKIY